MEEKYVTYYKGKEIKIPKEVLDDLYNKRLRCASHFQNLKSHPFMGCEEEGGCTNEI